MRELIFSTSADEPRRRDVGEVLKRAEIAERVSEVSQTCFVIALDDPSKRPRLCDTLLRHCPKTAIIAVASQENCSVFYWGIVSTFTRAEIEASEQGFSMQYECRTHGCRNR